MDGILGISREKIQSLVSAGKIRRENLQHFDICKALSEGMTQEQVAQKFGIAEDRTIRYVKAKKCPNCTPIL